MSTLDKTSILTKITPASGASATTADAEAAYRSMANHATCLQTSSATCESLSLHIQNLPVRVYLIITTTLLCTISCVARQSHAHCLATMSWGHVATTQ